MQLDLATCPVGTVYARGNAVFFVDGNGRSAPILGVDVRLTGDQSDIGRVENVLFDGMVVVAWQHAEADTTEHCSRLTVDGGSL